MNKADFIYNSINDAREIIKMIDLKANFLVFFIVIITGGLLKFSSTQHILKIITIYFGFFIILLLFLFVFIARLNPEEEIESIELESKYKKLFFPSNVCNYKYFLELLKNTDENILQAVLLYERLKLQVIIEKKIKSFNCVVKYLFPIYILLVGICIL